MPHDYDLEPAWSDLAWEDENAYDDEDYPYALDQGDGDYDDWFPEYQDVDLELDRDYHLGDTVD